MQTSLDIIHMMYFRTQEEIFESCFELKDDWEIIQFEMYPNIICKVDSHCQGQHVLTKKDRISNHVTAIRIVSIKLFIIDYTV